MPRVTIGLPVYNGAKYLEQSLSSLCGQSCDDLEIVISDNASTDGTREICLAWAGRDPRIRYHRNERNIGAARNYNRVWELARGELFKWASHDDLCAPTLVARCIEALEANPAAVLSYPRTVLIDSQGRRIRPYRDDLHLTSPRPAERFRQYLFRSAQECNAVFGLIRSRALRRSRLIGGYNASDRVLLADLALQGPFLEIPEELFFRRDHPETSLRANPNPKDVATWFDPDHRRRLVLPVSRLYGEFVRCVLRADLGPLTQAYCLLLVAKRFWWQRESWRNELCSIPGHLARLVSPPGSGKSSH